MISKPDKWSFSLKGLESQLTDIFRFILNQIDDDALLMFLNLEFNDPYKVKLRTDYILHGLK